MAVSLGYEKAPSNRLIALQPSSPALLRAALPKPKLREEDGGHPSLDAPEEAPVESKPTHRQPVPASEPPGAGSPPGLDELFDHVYTELRERARAQRRRWSGNETLDTTALLHEAYLKLAGAEGSPWQGRAHFLAVASKAMRQILVDYGRGQRAAKRGGGREHVTFDELALDRASRVPHESVEAFVRLDDALARLEDENPRHARIVECRFFGGMTVPETAAALGLSPATVKRGWTIAQAWLYRDLSRPPEC